MKKWEKQLKEERNSLEGKRAAGPIQPDAPAGFKKRTIHSKTYSFSTGLYYDSAQEQAVGEKNMMSYDVSADSASCFCCDHFGGDPNSTFAGGSSNWNNIAERWKKHLETAAHKRAKLEYDNYLKGAGLQPTIDSDRINQKRIAIIADNFYYIKTLFESLLFLGRQNLAIRGHDESENSSNKGNFLELLDAVERIDEKFRRIRRNVMADNAHYTSVDTQEEIIESVGSFLTKEIVAEIKQNEGIIGMSLNFFSACIV